MAGLEDPLQPSLLETPRMANPLALTVTFHAALGAICFEWRRLNESREIVAHGRLLPSEAMSSGGSDLIFIFDHPPNLGTDGCRAIPASTRALLNRLRKRFPIDADAIRLGLVTDQNVGAIKAGSWVPLRVKFETDSWRGMAITVLQYARLVQSERSTAVNAVEAGRTILKSMVDSMISGVAPTRGEAHESNPLFLDLTVTFDQVKCLAEFLWRKPETKIQVAAGQVRCTGADQLTWELECDGRREPSVSSHRRSSIRGVLSRWLSRFPTRLDRLTAIWVQSQPGTKEPIRMQEPPFANDESPFDWLEDNLVAMAEALRFQYSGIADIPSEYLDSAVVDFESYDRRFVRKAQKRAEEEARRKETMARLAEERRRREAAACKSAPTGKTIETPKPAAPVSRERLPLPSVGVHFEPPALSLQETAFPLADLRGYSLQERAALWWVSNQSDDLLCLPNCRIEHLDYQLRTALRVLGPLRGPRIVVG